MLCVYFITHKIYKYVCVLTHLSRVWFFMSGHQAPLSMGFSRQEYWSGLPCPPPGDLPNPRIYPASLMSPALGGKFTNSTKSRGIFGVGGRQAQESAEMYDLAT